MVCSLLRRCVYASVLTLAAACACADTVGVVFWKDGNLISVARVTAPGQDKIEAAMCALALGPTPEEQAEGVVSAIPRGTSVLAVSAGEGLVQVDFSRDIVGPDFGEAALEAIFTQVRSTLLVNGVTADVRMTAEGARLAGFLPPTPEITPRREPPKYTVGGALSGRKITVSPGHGYVWAGTGWAFQRGITCASTGLAREDDHNLEICQYLEQYLLADGATVKMCRCTDKSYGTHAGTGKPWWQMAACYWLKNIGYPCSVYGSSTGCTLESGSSEINDDIRARPLSSDYDASDIFISLHTNAYSGDCYGSCPTGSDVFYDCSPEHAAWCNVSRTLEQTVYPAMLDAIRSRIPDPTWNNHGVHEDTQGNYGEIRIPDRAAILIELAYHDTCDRDALRLADNFFRSAAMWGIYKGICDYFGVAPTYDFYSNELVSHDIPATMTPGSVRTVHITFRNRGVLWNQARGFKLGAVGDSDPFTTTIRHDVPAETGPSQTCTFTFDITAPTTNGTYVTDWRMLREGYQWFGATCSQTIQVTGTPDTTPPSVPTNLSGYAPSQTQVNLTWTPSTDNVAVAYYRVFRNASPVGTSPTPGYSDTTCSADTTYTYRVSAVDTSGNESAQSAPFNITTPPYIQIIIDEEAATTSGAWSLSTGAGSAAWNGDYKWTTASTTETAWAKWTPSLPRAGNWAVSIFYREGTNRTLNAPYTVYYDGGSQTFHINQTTGGGQWNYLATRPFAAGTSGYVKLSNATGETSTAVIADAVKFDFVSDPYTPDTEPPTVPADLNATAVSPTRVDLTWTASTDNIGVAGYRIYRDGTLKATSSTTTYSDTDCQPATTYSYRVSAYDAAQNESGQSAPAQVTTPAQQVDIIIDEEAASYSGSWSDGTYTPGEAWNGDYKWTMTASSETASAIWTPNLPQAGSYSVYVYYRQGSNRSVKAPYTIYYSGGSQTYQVDQTTNGATWVYLGTKPFAAGTSGYVKLGNNTGESSKVVIADAVKFVYAGGGPPSAVTVTDEGAWTCSQTTLKAWWTASQDASGTGINRYEYAVGTGPSSQNVRSWTSVGLATSATISGLSLAEGQQYFVQVRAVDNLGQVGPASAADGIKVAPAVAKIGQAWAKSNATDGLSLRNKVVTAAFAGSFWLEELDRSSAIEVISTVSVSRGNTVSAAGTLGLSGTRRVLFADVVENHGGTATLPRPLGVTTKRLGGAAFNASTPGVTGGTGLYNIGLLVRCAGRVTYSDSTDPNNRYFVLDDGGGLSWNGHAGVLVRCGAVSPPTGGWAVVTGICASESWSGKTVPVLLVRDSGDIRVL